jgi:hypothetical protein
VNISTMLKAAIESAFFMICLFSGEGENCITENEGSLNTRRVLTLLTTLLPQSPRTPVHFALRLTPRYVTFATYQGDPNVFCLAPQQGS